jgi:hydrogenase maturation protein HypF
VRATGAARQRLQVRIRGAVQGVGFRPFVYRLATELGLPGWVINSSAGVVIEVDGEEAALDRFLLRVGRECPPRAIIQGIEAAFLEAAGFTTFEIRESVDGEKTALVLPDIATCADCLRDVGDPGGRRFRYPFTNCTNCGPRFTIIEALPYDRPNTTMAAFRMCEACAAEYHDPRDRRFHAQPNACPACGPHLELWDAAGACLASNDAALAEAGARIAAGACVAVKGLGGFHLVVDARNGRSVQQLRQAKAREEKPFALMFPSLDSVQRACEVSEREARLLTSPEAPIVLLRRRRAIAPRSSPLAPDLVADAVAPGNPYLGVMLPATPLHHLLLGDLGFPIVATSGNRSDEPICTDEREALERLRGLADAFLVHDRPIARHVDDSIVRLAAGRELLIRRARGYAPLPVQLQSFSASRVSGGREAEGEGRRAEAEGEGRERSGSVLGVGAHLKSTVALAVGTNIFVSQHIGDLETPEAYGAFERVIDAFERMYAVVPSVIACDAHPDYLSTGYARRRGIPVHRVQHHLAHVLGCMAENEVAPPALGVAWDGTGFGPDGTIWGGEFFSIEPGHARRAASFAPFPLPGGDRAIKEPRRTAIALLAAVFGDAAWDMDDLPPVASCSPVERQVMRAMIERDVNAPRTSSAGRLFDGVASLAEIRHRVRYEGQAAMELEFALDGVVTDEHYSLPIIATGGLSAKAPRAEASGGRAKAEGRGAEGGTAEGTAEGRRAEGGTAEGGTAESTGRTVECGPHAAGRPSQADLLIDWSPLVRAVADDVRAGCAVGLISARFHNAMAEAIVGVARRCGLERIVLSGGCFQNRYLLERAVARLEADGFRPCWPQRIPPNDGGISLGQVVAVAWGIALDGDSDSRRQAVGSAD